MRNHRDNIKNEIAYFYTVIKNMDMKDSIKESKIKDHEISFEDVMYDNFSNDFDVDKHYQKQNLLGWIELIENENLHKAVKSLSVEEQIFISYIVKERRTQRELSGMYKIAQQNISKRFNNIIKKLRKFIK